MREAKIKTSGIEREDGAQFGFLGTATNEVCEELKSLDLNSMTPMQALTALYDLQAKAKNM